MAGDLARPKQPSSAHFITYFLVGPHLYTRMTGRHTGTKDNSETLLGALGLRKKEMLRQCSARARLTTVCGVATRARSSLLGKRQESLLYAACKRARAVLYRAEKYQQEK